MKTSPTTRDAMQVAEGLRAERQRLNDAIDARIVAVAAAEATEAEAARQQADNDTAAAVAALSASPDAALKSLEAVGKRIATTIAAARADRERHQRIAAALRDRLTQVEADVTAHAAVLRTAMASHGQEVARSLDAELTDALGPVLQVFRRAYLIATLTGSRALFERLRDVRIPNLATADDHADGITSKGFKVDLDFDAGDLARVAAEPLRVLRLLEGYTSRADRDRTAAAKPYVRRGITVERDTGRPGKAADIEPQPQRPRQQPAPAATDFAAAVLADPDLQQFR